MAKQAPHVTGEVPEARIPPPVPKTPQSPPPGQPVALPKKLARLFTPADQTIPVPFIGWKDKEPK